MQKRCYNCQRLLDDMHVGYPIDNTNGDMLSAIDLCIECAKRPYYADKPRMVYPLKYISASLTMVTDDINFDRPLQNCARISMFTGKGETRSQLVCCDNLLQSMFRVSEPVRDGHIGMRHSMGTVTFFDENDEYFGYVRDYDILRLIVDGGTVEIILW